MAEAKKPAAKKPAAKKTTAKTDTKVEKAAEPVADAPEVAVKLVDAVQATMVASREVGEASRAETIESRNKRRAAQHEAIAKARVGG